MKKPQTLSVTGTVASTLPADTATSNSLSEMQDLYLERERSRAVRAAVLDRKIRELESSLAVTRTTVNFAATYRGPRIVFRTEKPHDTRPAEDPTEWGEYGP